MAIFQPIRMCGTKISVRTEQPVQGGPATGVCLAYGGKVTHGRSADIARDLRARKQRGQPSDQHAVACTHRSHRSRLRTIRRHANPALQRQSAPAPAPITMPVDNERPTIWRVFAHPIRTLPCSNVRGCNGSGPDPAPVRQAVRPHRPHPRRHFAHRDQAPHNLAYLADAPAPCAGDAHRCFLAAR